MVTISEDPKIIVFRTEDLTDEHDDMDADVEVEDGNGRWGASFITLERIESIMREHERIGYNRSGLYFWSSDLVIVRRLSYDVIRETVEDLQQTGHFTLAFTDLDRD